MTDIFTVKLKKYLLIAAGSISLGLGILGIFLPLLPTTPFLLITAFCYTRSSKRLYNWLINQKHIGRYIKNYVNHHSVTKKTKVVTITFLWITLILSGILINKTAMYIVLSAVGVGVTTHLLLLKTFDADKADIEE